MRFYISSKDSSKGTRFCALYMEFAGLEKALCFEKETLTLIALLMGLASSYDELLDKAYNNKIYINERS